MFVVDIQRRVVSRPKLKAAGVLKSLGDDCQINAEESREFVGFDECCRADRFEKSFHLNTIYQKGRHRQQRSSNWSE